MTGSDPQQGSPGSDLAGDAAPPTTDATGAASTSAAGSPTADVRSPRPLTPLTSLVGDAVEGGSACAADGTCD